MRAAGRRRLGTFLHRRPIALRATPGLLETLRYTPHHLVGLGLAHNSLLDQSPRPKLAHRRMRADLVVHQRLGEGWLVAFVMAPTAIADQIDQEVFAKTLDIRVG